jgi:hypothetical protein
VPPGKSSAFWTQTARTLEAGADVVLEIGLIQQHDRERLYARVDDGAHDLVVYVLDAPRDVRRARVERRNRERGEFTCKSGNSVPVPDDNSRFASLWPSICLV